MESTLLSGTTFVPMIGPVRWIGAVENAGDGTTRIGHLATYGPDGHLTVDQQQHFLEYEPQLPSIAPKQVRPTVRFVCPTVATVVPWCSSRGSEPSRSSSGS